MVLRKENDGYDVWYRTFRVSLKNSFRLVQSATVSFEYLSFLLRFLSFVYSSELFTYFFSISVSFLHINSFVQIQIIMSNVVMLFKVNGFGTDTSDSVRKGYCSRLFTGFLCKVCIQCCTDSKIEDRYLNAR